VSKGKYHLIFHSFGKRPCHGLCRKPKTNRNHCYNASSNLRDLNSVFNMLYFNNLNSSCFWTFKFLFQGRILEMGLLRDFLVLFFFFSRIILRIRMYIPSILHGNRRQRKELFEICPREVDSMMIRLKFQGRSTHIVTRDLPLPRCLRQGEGRG